MHACIALYIHMKDVVDYLAGRDDQARAAAGRDAVGGFAVVARQPPRLQFLRRTSRRHRCSHLSIRRRTLPSSTRRTY